LPGPLGLLGHSRGGADALLFASREPRVRAVATLASVDRFAAEPADLEEVLRARGYCPILNARTRQEMPVARHAFESAGSVVLEAAARSLRCPALLAHGRDDEAVPFGALGRLAAWCPAAETLALDGAGHTLGAVHPFRGPTPPLVAFGDALAAFFRRHLPAR
jgi:pimeloyl-ACP methyl ester carboxylesterase